jgi:putative membrane protein
VLRKAIVSTACVTLLMAGACNRDYDAGSVADRTAGAESVDQQFVQKAAADNIGEIQLGRLATQRAESPSVKQFAERVVDDHTKALDALTTAAGQSGTQVTRELDDKHREIHERLSRLQGAAFDREYMKTMVQAHEDAVNMLEDRAERAPRAAGTAVESPEGRVNQWAADTLPVVQTHLQQAKQISGRL